MKILLNYGLARCHTILSSDHTPLKDGCNDTFLLVFKTYHLVLHSAKIYLALLLFKVRVKVIKKLSTRETLATK